MYVFVLSDLKVKVLCDQRPFWEDIMARKQGSAAKGPVAPPVAGGGRDPNRAKILMTDMLKVGLPLGSEDRDRLIVDLSGL